MALKQKLQGRTLDLNKSQRVFKETWYGTEAEVDTYINGLTLGTFTSGKGFLTAISKKQENAAIWTAEITYSIDYGENAFNNTSTTIVGKKSAQLSVRNIQMPLEKRPSYLANWNYYLYGLGDVDTPAFWEDATDIIIEDEEDYKVYKWGKQGEVNTVDPNSEGKRWRILEKPTKPGVEYFDYAVFVVSQSAKYGSASAAGAAISKNINHIVSPSNTFGITGGNWKLDQSSIQYDGKAWIATSVYTHSGDADGWDEDLYGNNA